MPLRLPSLWPLGPPLLCLLLLCPVLARTQPLALATDALPPRSRPDGTGYEDRIVAEAFRRIGLAVRLEVMPAERCLVQADKGHVGGVYARVAGLSEKYPNLVMVPEPVDTFEFVAYSRRDDLRIAGWADLRPLSVGIITGWKIVEDLTREVRARTSVRDEEALFGLLRHGRVDVVVTGGAAGREVVRRTGYTELRPHSPPLAVRPMHLYLNRRHGGLAPRLAEALRQMRADGSLERLLRAGSGGGGE